MDVSGRILLEGVISEEKSTINLSTFTAGIYLITIKNSSYTQTDRIVLQ